MKKPYLETDVLNSYRWLGHEQYTELNAYHPLYRPGKEHFEENKRNNAFPRVRHVRSGKEVLNFVGKYADTYTTCYVINPRPRIFRNQKGFPRSAYEHEIELAQNMLFDLDIRGREFSGPHREAVERFIERSKGFFLDQDLKPPVPSFSGRGYHLLMAYPPVKVAEHRDIAQRQRAFAEMYGNCSTKLEFA